MEGIGETLENVGLAQEISKGLAAGLQKPPKFAEIAAEIESMKASLGDKAGWAVYSESGLAKYCIKTWASTSGVDLSQARRKSSAAGGGSVASPTEGGVNANWGDFKASAAFEVLCKYMAYADKIAKEPVTQKQFEEMRPLGRGAFGAVWLVFKKDSGMPLATKRMFKTNAKENKMINDVIVEREVLSKIVSPFCVNLHYAFQNDVEVSLVITLMPGGDLNFLLKSRYKDEKDKDIPFKPLPAKVLQFYTASMALGLEAIHKAGYVYRDLKPQNVLLDAEGQVRLSDMGLVAEVKDKPIHNKAGTRGYWSPETINKEPYQYEPDWWSLGVTVYVLASDKLPFHGKTDDEKDGMTLAGVIDFSHGESPEVQKLISDLCTIDTSKRLGCKGGVADLKSHPYFAGFSWDALEDGSMEAEIKPNPNDINAPSKKDIEGFKPSKAVTWDPDDQAKFASWEHMEKSLWCDMEAVFRIKNKKELSGGGGGGGCCTIA